MSLDADCLPVADGAIADADDSAVEIDSNAVADAGAVADDGEAVEIKLVAMTVGGIVLGATGIAYFAVFSATETMGRKHLEEYVAERAR